MNPDPQNIGQPTYLSLSFPQVLLAPLRALRIGHIFFLTYILGLGLLTTWGLGELSDYLPRLLKTSSSPTPRWILRSAEYLAWLPMVPILLALCVAPLKTIWLAHSLKFSILVKFTVACLGRSFQSVQIFMRQGLIWLLLPAGLFFGFQQIQPYMYRNPQLKPLMILIFMTVCLIALVKVSQALLLMLMVIATNMDVGTASYHRLGLLQNQLFKILSIDLLCLILGFLGHHLINYLVDLVAWSTALKILTLSLIIWYAVSTLTVLALEASEKYAQKMGRTFRSTG